MNDAADDPVHVLLVDDLDENLLSLEALLRRDGIATLKARSGAEALELLLTHDVALALLDVQMPVMDGFELAELMRSTERTRRVPIIFLTAGSADWHRRFRGYETGAVDFIQKPIEPDILRSKAKVFFDLYIHQRQVAHQRDELKVANEANARLLQESLQYAIALKDADRRKDEFLATLAHELRNPLAPIRNGLNILRMLPEEETQEKVREMMDRQLTHLVRLIDDLLDVSRVSQGKIDLRRERITIKSAVEAAAEASRPLIETGKHKLSISLPNAPLWLNADLTRLTQIISNLLNNAAKYTPEGGKIMLGVREENGQAVLSVSDNGLGIPEDMLPKVFELFTQVDHNLDRAQGGLGIGLALVRQLVDLHGGTISVESGGLGNGSTFTLRMPVLASDTPPLTEPDSQTGETVVSVTPLKVLVVDDNIPSAQTTGWMLEMIGHTPRMAHDGPDAIVAARDFAPDVILLDIGLPGMSGYDVCRELRKDPAFRDTVFIAQTGWGQERDRQNARDAGFDHHLIKPVHFEKFSELLATVKPHATPDAKRRKAN